MSTRRGFLVSTLAVATVPLVARAGSLGDAPIVRVITESICPDTLSFAARFGIQSNVVGGDPAEFLFDLERELRYKKVDLIYGLSRASTQFLVEQTAIPHRYRTCYAGQHRYVDQRLVHTLSGSCESIDIVTGRLQLNTKPWTVALADAVGVLGGSAALIDRSEFAVASKIPQDSSRHLVSWLLRPVG